MADRFFVPAPPGPGEYVLGGPEAHHLANVRRQTTGDLVSLFCGDGLDYPAEVIAVSKKSTVLMVAAPRQVDRELGFPIVVASAMPKGDRADYLVEKLTELGATRLIPLITTRSVVAPKESQTDKRNRQVIEACKQCGRNVLMVVEPPQLWNRLLTRPDLPITRLILHPATNALALHQQPIDASGVCLAVGPEGGFTDDELADSLQAGWLPVTLGPRILRIETAATAAVACLSSGSVPAAGH